MISEKQLEANRRNALRSTGPTSAEGKKRCGLNNLRHGLAGRAAVLPTEDRERHDHFCAEIVHCLGSENALECQIARSIAEDHWRLNRAGAIESNVLALGLFESQNAGPVDDAPEDPDGHAALTIAGVFFRDAQKFALLSLYEQRIHRNLQRNMKRLRDLQTERMASAPYHPSQEMPHRKWV